MKMRNKIYNIHKYMDFWSFTVGRWFNTFYIIFYKENYNEFIDSTLESKFQIYIWFSMIKEDF